jgi:hypothetical protein
MVKFNLMCGTDDSIETAVCQNKGTERFDLYRRHAYL